ncbi:MAG: PAS domain-containing protein, partial [Silvanigrellaceae bacterium]|nr:PAS domain-containing protein [Silvanigrellaceae bacterium]
MSHQKLTDVSSNPPPQILQEEVIAFLPGIVYWTNIHSALVGCNNNLAKILGLSSHKEIIGISAEQFGKLSGWTNSQLDLFKSDNAEIVKTAVHKFSEEFIIDVDGNKLSYYTHRVPISNENKEAIGVIHISIDTTQQEEIDRKSAELENANLIFLSNLTKKIIGESSEDYQTAEEYVHAILHYLDSIIACMPGNIYWTDKKSVYLGCNDNTAKYFGLKSRSEIIGITYKDMARLGGWT